MDPNKSVPEPWLSFLRELDSAVEGEIRLDCMGGFVVTMVYGFSRPTADLDVLEIAPREAGKAMLELGVQGGRLHKKYKIYRYEGTMQTACLRLMGKKLLVALTMEGKFAGEGLQSIDEDDDMLSAMARELVERNGIGETADAVWKALNTEHQKLFPTASRSDEDVPLIEAASMLPGTQLEPAALVEEAMAGSSALIFGRRPGSPSRRRTRGRPAVPEQASLFGFS